MRLQNSRINRDFFRRIVIAAIPILIATPLVVRARSSASFRIIDKWHIGGTGTWNRLMADPENHRLYVTRGEKIIVVDTLTGKQIGEIAGSKSIRTVCLNPDSHTGYFTDSVSGVVRVFDVQTLRVTGSVVVGIDPDAAVFDEQSSTLLVLNDGSKDATLIATADNCALATITLPGRPASAVTNEEGLAFVSLNDSKELVRIDLRNHKLLGTWSEPDCSGPSGLAINPAKHVVYSVCENNRLVALDSRTGQLLSTADLPEGTRDIVFDMRRKLLFGASGSGTLTILKADHAGHLALLQTLRTMPGTRTVAVDSSTGRVYLDASQFGQRTGDTSEELRFRPTPIPNSFLVLVIAG
jgi:DNA-binding beta-propeller fold protein YncE